MDFLYGTDLFFSHWNAQYRESIYANQSLFLGGLEGIVWLFCRGGLQRLLNR